MTRWFRHVKVAAGALVGGVVVAGGAGCEAIVSNDVPSFTCQLGGDAGGALCGADMYCRGAGCVPCESADTCDGLDNDCDGVVDNGADADHDGYSSCGAVQGDGTLGGADCDDGDASVHPGAQERCDGVDDDCNGVVDDPDRVCAPGTRCDPSAARCVAGSDDGGPGDSGGDAGPLPPSPSPGDIVITEIMFNPSTAEPPTEWFEVYNSASSARLLSGLTIVDGGSRTHVIAASPAVTIGARAYGLLVSSRSAAVTTAKLPDAAILYEYGGTATIQLSNDVKGAIGLQLGGAVLTTIPYGTFALGVAGASLESKSLDAASGGTASGWCVASAPWAGVDKGTPGAVNDCP